MGSALPLPPPGFDALDVDEQMAYVDGRSSRIALPILKRILARADCGRTLRPIS